MMAIPIIVVIAATFLGGFFVGTTTAQHDKVIVSDEKR